MQQRMMEDGLLQAQGFHPDTVQREVELFWRRLASELSGNEAPIFFSAAGETAGVESER
jgi:hypothetical protein